MLTDNISINLKIIIMQDTRYVKLRKSLDGLKMQEHLNPDSVDLVEKLFNEYVRSLDIYNKLKKKMNESKPDVSSYQNQIDLLNEKYGEAKEENERLKKRIDENGIQQKIQTLQSALNSCRIKYEKKLDEMGEKIGNYQFQIEELTISKTSLADQNQRIRVMLEKNKIESQNISTQLTSILDKKKKQIQRLEEENSKYRLQISSLQRIYNQEKQTKNASDGEIERKSSLALQVLKQELSQTEEKLKLAKRQIQQERQANQQLRVHVKNLNEKLGQLRSQEDYAKNSYHIESNAKSKYQSMYQQSQNKVEELKQKLSISEQAKAAQDEEIGRLNEKIKELVNKNKTMMGNMNKIQEELAVLNSNFTTKVRELREAENQKATLQRKIKDLQTQIKQHEEKSEQVGFNNGNSTKMSQEYEKKLSILEKQVKINQEELKIMQENEQAILSEKAKVQTEVKKLQLIIGEGNKQIELIQMQKQSLMKENKQLKSHLSSTQSEGYNNKTQTVRLKETIDQHEIIIQDLRIALRNQQNVSKAFAQKANEFEKAVAEQINNNRQIFEDNKQLKLMVGSLQKVKADLFEKYKSSTEEKALKQEDRIEYLKEYNKLMEENKQVLDKLRRKQSALAQINNEYDNLQNILDDKTEENVKLLETIRKLQKQLASYDRGIGQREMSLQGQHSQIKNLQREIEKLQNLHNMKCEELNDCQIELNRRTLDVQQLNNEVSLLVKSNKQYERSIEREKLKMQDLERKLKDRIKEVDELRQVSSSLKIENQALTDEIRRSKQQQTNAIRLHDEVVDAYNNLHNIFQEKVMEAKEMEEMITHLQFKQTQNMSEINQYERQLRSLGEEMIKKDEELERLANDRDIYRAEVNTSRRSYSNSTDWKIVYEDKIRGLQNQIAVKKRECEAYRMEMRKYEKIIESERQKNYCLEEQIRKSKVHDSQTPIKMFYKSRVESENWNGYNRDLSQMDKSSDMDHLSKHSRMGGESFETERVSTTSKQIRDNLDEITRMYNQTISVNKVRK